jgi:hypothetical protein
MLYFARWKIVLIVLVVLGGFVATLPNFFPKETVANWPDWMPKRQLVLGRPKGETGEVVLERRHEGALRSAGAGGRMIARPGHACPPPRSVHPG